MFMSTLIVYKFNTTQASSPALLRLPARFGHSWDLPVERQLAEANAADAELAKISARPAATFAAIVAPHSEFWSSVRLNDF
jgi:hypothetical protein